jgi:Legume lectin domain/FG-GAP-like repeat/Bacterial Ig-like domain (group 3)
MRVNRVILPLAFALNLTPLYGLTTSTTTTLTVTAAGNAVTSVNSGTTVTLTAAVQSAGAGVSPGTVNFCDASATYCTDIHLVGTAQLTSTGTATFRFVPGPGSHSYKAVFAGTTSYAPSTSSTSPLSVGLSGGLYRSATAIAQSGTPGNYTLTTTVGGNGNTAPTGIVSFLDTSDGNALLGKVTLVTGVAGLNFVNSSNPGTGGQGIAVADFNGDGIPDMAVASNAQVGTVEVLLGNGDGTFSEVPTSPSTGIDPFAIAVGDFNGDGIPDLAVTNIVNGTGDGTVTVLLGNGDGTFSPTANTLATGSQPLSIAVGDFNQDGNADLAVANVNDNAVTVLLGNGHGKFTPTATSPATGSEPRSIAVGDFNGDGIPDLAVGNYSENAVDGDYATVTILLGDGHGNFTGTPTSPEVPLYPSALAVGDFNGDGILDLAVTSLVTGIGNGTVTVLLGNGNATFTATGTSMATGIYPFSITIGDFNGDGIPDLAVTNSVNDGTVTVLLGNGDGMFSPTGMSPAAGTDPGHSAVADFNGDGISDLAASGGYSVTVLLAETQQTAAASTTAVPTLPPSSGIHQVVASYAGDGNYTASTSGPTGLTGLPTVPSVTLTSSASVVTYGTSVMLTATVTGSGVTATGYVSFLDGTTTLAVGTLNGGGVSIFTTNTLAIGPHSITASYGGDFDYTATASKAVTVNVSRGLQTITFPPVGNPIVGTSVNLAATASSGLPVIYNSLTSGVCTVSGSTAKLIAVGTCIIQATQAGNADYVPATPVSQSFSVVNLPTKIDFSHGFSGANGPMQFNGSTTLDGSRLSLTSGVQYQAGSAFYATPIGVQSFTTNFTFRLSNAVADGFTFTIQNVRPGALGGSGGRLGYAGIGKSVAIKFDLYNNRGEGPDSTGLYIDGAAPNVPAINLANTGIHLHSGDPMSVHISYNIGYNGGELILTITDQVTNAVWSNSFAVDIPATVGGNTAYVGFTGATGDDTSTQAITSWTYEVGQ